MITHKNEIIEPVKNLEQDMNKIKIFANFHFWKNVWKISLKLKK